MANSYIDKIEEGKGVVYHELGHLLAYCLSNKSENSSLGEVELIQIGFNINSVNPKKYFYHFENVFNQRNEILENTSKIERTIAWFIEVISGCTFQILYENLEFKNCFGAEDYKIGSVDFNNLSVIRNLSFFKWTFNDIYSLQIDYQDLIKKFNIIFLLRPLVDSLTKRIEDSQDNQLKIECNELYLIIEEINQLLTAKLIEEYLELIHRYKLKFTK